MPDGQLDHWAKTNAESGAGATSFGQSIGTTREDRRELDFPVITSRQNPRIKNAVKLREHKHRKNIGRTLIDGAREVERAMAAGVVFVEVFIREDFDDAPDKAALLVALAAADAAITRVSTPVFEKVAFGGREEGIVAVAAAESPAIESISLPDEAVVCVLDGIEKPGNLGAIARTVDAAGVAALLHVDGRTDLFNPNAIRASLGLLFSIPAADASAAEARRWLLQRDIALFAAVPGAVRDYTSVNFASGAAVIFGNEADGISDVWKGDPVTPISLPMVGVGDSLNVSAAAAIVFYEAQRQRKTEQERRAQ